MAKMGRPKKTKAERKGELMPFRVSADERKAIDAAAERAGMGRSDWIRKVLIDAANCNTISADSKTEGAGVEPHRGVGRES
jgi:uncharacterized protein (DUF1778 family)